RRRVAFIAATALVIGGLAVPTATAQPPSPGDAAGTTYFVDCDATAPGIGTRQAPLTSLGAVGELRLEPGDAVLFKRGSTCTGALTTQGSGTAEAPLLIDAYGDGTQLPRIDGQGVAETVLLDNQEYWEIRNLEITNIDPTPSARFTAMRRGVVIKNTDAGQLSHFRLENLYIHDVTGQNKKDLGGSGGIQVEVYPGSVPSWFDDVVIANNRIEDVNRSGINMSTAWLCRQEMAWDSGYCTKGDNARNPWTPSTGLVIRDNVVDGTGGDGIVVQMNKGAVVEGNVVSDAANRANQGSNAGVWAWNADDTVFRGNTVTGTRKLAGNNDGTSFDIDYGTRNTVFEHNVSYANEGGMVFFCGCAASWLPNAGFASEGVYRYNFSIGEISRVGFLAGATDGAFYNNTIVITDDSAAEFLSVNNAGSSILLANNLVVSLRQGGVTSAAASSPNLLTWRNNAFYSVDAASTWPGTQADGNQKLDIDDLPAAALAALEDLAVIDGTGELDLTTLTQVTAPNLAGAGIAVAEEGTVDLFGNAVPHRCAPDIGAYQFSEVDDETCAPPAQLADGASADLTLPATSTVRIDATLSPGATFTVANERGLVQTARPVSEGGSAVFSVVRTDATQQDVTLSCSGGSCSDIAVGTVSDVVVDGSFESLFTTYSDRRTSPWSIWNSGRSTTVVAGGGHSTSLTPGSTGAGSELVHIPVQPGQTYELAGWIHSSVAGKTQGVSLGAKWGQGTEETGTAFNAFSTVAGQWQHASVRFTVPQNVGNLTLYCYQPAASGTSYCDDVTMTAVVPTDAHLVAGPRDVSVSAGASAHFHARTAGDHPHVVTWESSVGGDPWQEVRHDVFGTEIPVRSPWLSVDDVTADDDGTRYRATVTDAVTGARTVSELAMLTVAGPRGDAELGALVDLELLAGPTTSEYLLGDPLDITGLVVVAVFEHGRYQIVDPALLDVDESAFRPNRLGTQSIPVSFTADGNTASTAFTVEVVASRESLISCPAAGATATATFYQTQYGSFPGSLACDGNPSTSWSTWPGAESRPTDTITFALPEARLVRGIEVDWLEKAPTGAVTVQYRDAEGAWHNLAAPISGITLVGGAATSVVNADDPVTTDALRVVVGYTGADYTKVTEVRFLVVEAREVVEDNPVELATTTRCVAGKVTLVVQATNTGTEPASVAVSSPYGSKTHADLAPGRTVSSAFSSRSVSIPAGTVTAQVSVDGGEAMEATADYATASCS
ncbi:MAG TPA: right-handed parallel beta-helix repeat-containing protein, partial [Arachnia sp.]|nr:right-handed parallel beta-helix repeat-containing protein [Arachnia sp.]